MPIYEFICEDCKERFEIDVPMSQRDKVKCIKCGSKNLKRVYGGINILGVSKGNACSTCTSQTCSQCPLSQKKS